MTLTVVTFNVYLYIIFFKAVCDDDTDCTGNRTECSNRTCSCQAGFEQNGLSLMDFRFSCDCKSLMFC